MCGELAPKRADKRVCVCVSFFFIRKRGDGREGARGENEEGNEEGKERQRQRARTRGRTRSWFQCASERISRIFFGSDENAPYLRVRTAEMSHTAAINVDGSCSSLRQDPSAARFRSEGPRTRGRLVNMINVLICTVSRLQLSFPTLATRH